MATYSDFAKLDIRAGKIIKAEDFKEAKTPSYKVEIDFGPEVGVKKASVQLVWTYKKEELLGKHVVAIVNFPPKQIANFMSEVLVLGVDIGEKRCILLKPEKEVQLGGKVF